MKWSTIILYSHTHIYWNSVICNEKCTSRPSCVVRVLGKCSYVREVRGGPGATGSAVSPSPLRCSITSGCGGTLISCNHITIIREASHSTKMKGGLKGFGTPLVMLYKDALAPVFECSLTKGCGTLFKAKCLFWGTAILKIKQLLKNSRNHIWFTPKQRSCLIQADSTFRHRQYSTKFIH